MKNILLFLFLNILLFNWLSATDFTDTVRAETGKNVCLPYKLIATVDENADTIFVLGKITLSNSSLLLWNYNPLISDGNLMYFNSINDSVSTFGIAFASSHDTEFTREIQLCGECLAGSDTVCYAVMSDISINDSRIDDLGCVLLVDLNSPQPYIRFTWLGDNYPNPVQNDGATVWEYQIDKPSEVSYKIYNFNGRLIFEGILGMKERGAHYIRFNPENRLSCGMYIFRIITETGDVTKRFIIIDN